jgi:hypothetical protein
MPPASPYIPSLWHLAATACGEALAFAGSFRQPSSGNGFKHHTKRSSTGSVLIGRARKSNQALPRSLAGPGPALSGRLEYGNNQRFIDRWPRPYVLARPVTGWLGQTQPLNEFKRRQRRGSGLGNPPGPAFILSTSQMQYRNQPEQAISCAAREDNGKCWLNNKEAPGAGVARLPKPVTTGSPIL